MEEVIQDILLQAKAIKNEDGSYDVEGNVDLSGLGLTKLPIKFRYVSEGFYCCTNKLTSLEGAPQIVDGDFLCHNNNLTSLEGAPKEVSGNFLCSSNNLTSLKGIGEVKGKIFCGGNPVSREELLKTI